MGSNGISAIGQTTMALATSLVSASDVIELRLRTVAKPHSSAVAVAVITTHTNCSHENKLTRPLRPEAVWSMSLIAIASSSS